MGWLAQKVYTEVGFVHDLRITKSATEPQSICHLQRAGMTNRRRVLFSTLKITEKEKTSSHFTGSSKISMKYFHLMLSCVHILRTTRHLQSYMNSYARHSATTFILIKSLAQKQRSFYVSMLQAATQSFREQFTNLGQKNLRFLNKVILTIQLRF